jgi:hypothetical protein
MRAIPNYEDDIYGNYFIPTVNLGTNENTSIINDYNFQESHISGGQANVAVPIFEPIKIAPITFENTNPIMTLTPITSYFPITQPIFTTPIPVAPVFSTPTIDSKITISTMVYDEFGDPLPGANVHIDGKPIASTYNDGSVTVPGIATSTSTVRITYVGMKDYVISAVFLPKKVIMQVDVIALEGVTIIVPKKDTTVPYSAPVAKAGMSWLLWIALLAAGYKGMQYFKDDKPKTVKAKI